jgi:hypothetical protein
MNARADFVTLTIGFDTPADEVFAVLRGPSGPERRALRSMITHEFRHLYSYLASPISDLHYLVITAQVAFAHQALAEWRMGSLDLHVPFADSAGRLVPNVCSKNFADTFATKRAAWDSLEKLRSYLLSSGPIASEKELLDAARSLEHSHECLHFRDLVFIREGLRDWVGNDFTAADPFTGNAFPVLPYWNGFSNADAQATTISSLSVVEGLAVLGEVLDASQGDAFEGSCRFGVPYHYTVGLRFGLECINRAHGTTYLYSDLLSGSIPLQVVASLAGIFDLALQIPLVQVGHERMSLPASVVARPRMSDHEFNVHESLVELCPAWRLYFLCKVMAEKRIPLLESTDVEDTSDFREFQIAMLEDHLHWAHPDMFGTVASLRFVERYEYDKEGPPNAEAVFDYLTCLARAMRDKNEIAYIVGKVPKTPYAFDVVGFAFPNGQFMPRLGRDASSKFHVMWERNYYRLAACLFGKYWDKWWAEWGEDEFSEVLMCIRNALGAAARDSAALGHADTANPRWMALNAINLHVREDFEWRWRRSPEGMDEQTNRSPKACADLVAALAAHLAVESSREETHSARQSRSASAASVPPQRVGVNKASWLRTLLSRIF